MLRSAVLCFAALCLAGASLPAAAASPPDDCTRSGPPPAAGEGLTFLPGLPGLGVGRNATGPRLSAGNPLYRDFPAALKKKGIGGQVVLLFDVSKEGLPQHVEIVASDPPGVFDIAAMNTLADARFCPATEGGRPTAASGNRLRLEWPAAGGK